MTKRILLAGLAAFVVWEVLDFVIHGVILASTYATLPALFRPQQEMKMGVMTVVVLLAALSFAAAYGWFVGPKSVATGLKYGLVVGLGAGVAMGYGSYSAMPIPYVMALTWFLGSWVEYAVAGLLVGLIVTPAAT
ncbi:MAG: hypothetical protein ACOY3Y_18190 [Acidobacteriota bacterium]